MVLKRQVFFRLFTGAFVKLLGLGCLFRNFRSIDELELEFKLHEDRQR